MKRTGAVRSSPASPFWDEVCEELDAKRREALRTFRKNRTRDNFRLFKMAEARAKSGIKKVKKEKYRQFCESVTRFVSPSHVWSITKRFKNRWNKVGTSHEFKQEKIDGAKRLISEICPSWCASPKPDLTNAQGDSFLDEAFDEIEFEHALSMVNLASAPGIDGID